MGNNIQYGPYSPQEVERIIGWIQQKNINFELIRNDQEAKEALMNDGQNVVNLADLRTEIYLAQVFYINLINPSKQEQTSFEKLFSLKEEVYPAEKQPVVGDEKLLAEASLKNHLKKRSWSMILFVLLILQIVITFYFIFKRES